MGGTLSSTMLWDRIPAAPITYLLGKLSTCHFNIMTIMETINRCPYGTYQRALSSRGLSIAEAINRPATFNEAVMSRLSAKGKKDAEFVNSILEGAKQHLMNDFEIMSTFRL